MKKVFYAVLLLAAVIGTLLFLDRCVLVIKDVQVTGDGAVAEDIIRLSGVEMGGRIRGIDTEKLRLGVESTGVYSCTSVKTVYPSTVIITVEKRVPAVFTNAGGYMVLMDTDGYVMSVTRQTPEGSYIYITGLEGRSYETGRQLGADEKRLAAMKTVADSIIACGAADYVSEVNVADTKNLVIYSRTSICVNLGDTENMDAKITWMKLAVSDLEARGETSGKLDVSTGQKADYKAQ